MDSFVSHFIRQTRQTFCTDSIVIFHVCAIVETRRIRMKIKSQKSQKSSGNNISKSRRVYTHTHTHIYPYTSPFSILSEARRVRRYRFFDNRTNPYTDFYRLYWRADRTSSPTRAFKQPERSAGRERARARSTTDAAEFSSDKSCSVRIATYVSPNIHTRVQRTPR